MVLQIKSKILPAIFNVEIRKCRNVKMNETFILKTKIICLLVNLLNRIQNNEVSDTTGDGQRSIA